MSIKSGPLTGMRARAATAGASLGVAFALAAGGSLAGAAAPADAFVLKSTDTDPTDRLDYDHLNILRFPPRSPKFRPCINDDVRLPAGDFLHGPYIVSEKHRDDPDLNQALITIRVPGTYRWRACRGWNSRLSRYQVRSTLTGHRFSHTRLNTFQRDPNQLGPSRVYGNGRYEWGGQIDRYTPGATSPSR